MLNEAWDRPADRPSEGPMGAHNAIAVMGCDVM